MKKITEEQKQEFKRKGKLVGKTVVAGGFVWSAYQIGKLNGIREILGYIVNEGEIEVKDLNSGKNFLFKATEVIKENIKA